MTDETQKDETTEIDPAAKPAAEAPSSEDRGKALLAEFEHAHKHNAPVTTTMMAELRELLG